MKNPETELIINEINVRNMVLKDETLLTKRSAARWLAISLGLINPNESRTNLIDLLIAIFKFEKKGGATSKELYEEVVKKNNMSEKTILYHLLNLKKMGIVEFENGRYHFYKDPEKPDQSISQTLSTLYKKRFENAMKKIEKVIMHLENHI